MGTRGCNCCWKKLQDELHKSISEAFCSSNSQVFIYYPFMSPYSLIVWMMLPIIVLHLRASYSRSSSSQTFRMSCAYFRRASSTRSFLSLYSPPLVVAFDSGVMSLVVLTSITIQPHTNHEWSYGQLQDKIYVIDTTMTYIVVSTGVLPRCDRLLIRQAPESNTPVGRWYISWLGSYFSILGRHWLRSRNVLYRFHSDFILPSQCAVPWNLHDVTLSPLPLTLLFWPKSHPFVPVHGLTSDSGSIITYSQDIHLSAVSHCPIHRGGRFLIWRAVEVSDALRAVRWHNFNHCACFVYLSISILKKNKCFTYTIIALDIKIYRRCVCHAETAESWCRL